MLWSITSANFRQYHISLIIHMWKQINKISWYFDWNTRYAEKIRHDFGRNHDVISPNHGKHPSDSPGTLLMHLSESRVCKYNVLFHKLQAAGIYVVDTASSSRCYCSISRINNRRFSSRNNPPAWTIHSLKSIHAHSTLSNTDIYRLGASLCYSATSSITGTSVRHLEWVRNSCYCIELLPRVI